MKTAPQWKRVTTWYRALSPREKLLVLATAFGLVCYLTVEIFGAVQDRAAALRQTAARRSMQLEQLNRALHRYRDLSQRLQTMEALFAQSEMTVDQVYSELDRIVRESVGSGGYDLKRSPSGTPLSATTEQQDFTLRINALTMEQIVKLLHQLEQGKTALVLGTVNISKTAQAGMFSATFEVSTILRKKS